MSMIRTQAKASEPLADVVHAHSPRHDRGGDDARDASILAHPPTRRLGVVGFLMCLGFDVTQASYGQAPLSTIQDGYSAWRELIFVRLS